MESAGAHDEIDRANAGANGRKIKSSAPSNDEPEVGLKSVTAGETAL